MTVNKLHLRSPCEVLVQIDISHYISLATLCAIEQQNARQVQKLCHVPIDSHGNFPRHFSEYLFIHLR